MAAPARLTAAEYFTIDEAGDQRFELVQGELYAMAGGSPDHSHLCAAIGGILYRQLRGGPCRPFSSDLRVALSYNTFAYPDFTVVSGGLETHPDNSHTVTNPRIVFEVLSPTTQDYDRGREATLYREVLSIQAIVLIASDRVDVEVYERQGDGTWLLRRFNEPDGVVGLPAIEAAVPLAELYEGTSFGSRPPR